MALHELKRSKKSSTGSRMDEDSLLSRKNLMCTVCGADATGFNFSVITCMCCKAFFRRNALLGLNAFSCRYSREDCVMNIQTRRDCSYCRLKKCFDVGMKKELILTDEMKRLKREKITANRQMTTAASTTLVVRPVNFVNNSANARSSTLDLGYLNNIYNAYEQYCRSPIVNFEKQEHDALCQQPLKARMKLQHYLNYFHAHRSSLMSFYKRLPEFQQLAEDQQVALSSHNVFLLVRISLIETINDQLPLWPAINLLIESLFGKELINRTNDLIHDFKNRINDSVCIRLLVVILLFSTFNTYRGTIDTLHLYKIQEKYIELFWSYVQQRYGNLGACQKTSIIVRHCLHLQTIGHLADLRKEEIQWQNLFLLSE